MEEIYFYGEDGAGEAVSKAIIRPATNRTGWIASLTFTGYDLIEGKTYIDHTEEVDSLGPDALVNRICESRGLRKVDKDEYELMRKQVLFTIECLEP